MTNYKVKHIGLIAGHLSNQTGKKTLFANTQMCVCKYWHKFLFQFQCAKSAPCIIGLWCGYSNSPPNSYILTNTFISMRLLALCVLQCVTNTCYFRAVKNKNNRPQRKLSSEAFSHLVLFWMDGLVGQVGSQLLCIQSFHIKQHPGKSSFYSFLSLYHTGPDFIGTWRGREHTESIFSFAILGIKN